MLREFFYVVFMTSLFHGFQHFLGIRNLRRGALLFRFILWLDNGYMHISRIKIVVVFVGVARSAWRVSFRQLLQERRKVCKGRDKREMQTAFVEAAVGQYCAFRHTRIIFRQFIGGEFFVFLIELLVEPQNLSAFGILRKLAFVDFDLAYPYLPDVIVGTVLSLQSIAAAVVVDRDAPTGRMQISGHAVFHFRFGIYVLVPQIVQPRFIIPPRRYVGAYLQHPLAVDSSVKHKLHPFAYHRQLGKLVKRCGNIPLLGVAG